MKGPEVIVPVKALISEWPRTWNRREHNDQTGSPLESHSEVSFNMKLIVHASVKRQPHFLYWNECVLR